MSHATPEEIHDHAYGFRFSEHAAGCAECRRAVDLVLRERESLKNALREDPVQAPADLLSRVREGRSPRRRVGVPMLTAAALLLGALAWILFQPKSPVEPSTAAATSTHQEDVEKIVALLKSPSELKRDLARMALRRYGGTAVAALEHAGADPVLVEECRGYNLQDQEAIRKARTMKVNVQWKDTSLIEAVDQIREMSGFNMQISGIDNPSGIQVTLTLRNVPLTEVLDRLSAVTNVPWSRSRGQVPAPSALLHPLEYTPVFLFGAAQTDPPAFAPIRVRSIRAWAAAQVQQAPTDDQALQQLFGRLVQAADPSLWDYLDSPRADLRLLAERSLRRLYGPPAPAPKLPREAALEKSRLDLSMENTPFDQILLELGKVGQTSLVLDPRLDSPEKPATFKVKDLSLRNVLKLLLSQDSLDFAVTRDEVLITRPKWLPFRHWTGSPSWVSPGESDRAEAAIDGVLSSDPALRKTAAEAATKEGRRGAEWLRHAADVVDPGQRAALESASLSILSSLEIPWADRPAGVDAQALTAAQKILLGKTSAFASRDRTLGQLLMDRGVQVRLRVPDTRPLLVSSPGMTLDALLRTVTSPLGLDFYLDGETVVVDTEKNVRAAVDRK